jgi:hypothetical protein
MPPTPEGFSVCVRQEGDVDCPEGWPDRRIFYKSVTDTRSCSPCACSDPAGATCVVKADVFGDSTCSSVRGTVVLLSSVPEGGCVDLPPGTALGSKKAEVLAYQAGACAHSGGDLIGAVTREGPSTFCCL